MELLYICYWTRGATRQQLPPRQRWSAPGADSAGKGVLGRGHRALHEGRLARRGGEVEGPGEVLPEGLAGLGPQGFGFRRAQVRCGLRPQPAHQAPKLALLSLKRFFLFSFQIMWCHTLVKIAP